MTARRTHRAVLPVMIGLCLAVTNMPAVAADQSGAADHDETRPPARRPDHGSAQSPLPRPDHVVIVVEENHSYRHIFQADHANYFRALAQAGASFTNFHAIEHPSQPNYLDLFSGDNQGVTDDGRPDHLPFSTPNLGAELRSAGFTFTGYSEDLPKIGFNGDSHSNGFLTHQYVRKHNPWANWQVDQHTAPANRLPPSVNQPLSHAPDDLNKLSTVTFVIPNEQHDIHDGSIAQADQWLRKTLNGYALWALSHNSLLIVTWDEAETDNSTNRIPTILIGQMVKPGRYRRHADLFDLLRTVEDMYGLPHAGKSSKARPLTEAFHSPSKTIASSSSSGSDKH